MINNFTQQKKFQLHPWIIYIDIIRCFIMSAGISIIILISKEISVNRSEFIILMRALFLTEIIILLLYETFFGERWFINWESSKRLMETILSKAEIDKLSDNPDFNKEISTEQQRRSTIHEAGHALLAYILELDEYSVHMTYPRPHVKSLINGNSSDDVKKNILVYYAGAAAEEMVLGNFHAGSMLNNDSDFVMAKEYIKIYITLTNPDVSKAMLDSELEEQIIDMSKELYKEVKTMISENIEKLEIISTELMKKEYLSKEDINTLIGNVGGKYAE